MPMIAMPMMSTAAIMWVRSGRKLVPWAGFSATLMATMLRDEGKIFNSWIPSVWFLSQGVPADRVPVRRRFLCWNREYAQ